MEAAMSILEGVVLGIHLVSAHLPALNEQNNLNLGVSVRTESGLVVGVYKNTLGRTSVYAVKRLNLIGPLDIDLGLATGYQKKTEYFDCSQQTTNPDWTTCWRTPGVSNGYFIPVVSPSIRFSEVAGVVPRIHFVPSIFSGKSSVFHLSIEKTF